jgi:hypothetical protein
MTHRMFRVSYNLSTPAHEWQSQCARAEDARRVTIILTLASGSLGLLAISRYQRYTINRVRARGPFKKGLCLDSGVGMGPAVTRRGSRPTRSPAHR